MKKFLLLFALATASLVSAQATGGFSPTDKGNFVIETAVLSNSLTPNTGLGYVSVEDGVKMVNVGVNGGYFVAKDLAVKAGVGYGEMRFNERSYNQTWAFRAGMEYNISGVLPIEVAWTGTSTKGASENPSYLSTQLGYNWFVANNFGIKPLVRYDFNLKDDNTNILSFGLGFGYYF